ncbi:cyanophycinase [Singulisphaera sp. PoT]|uniref:cyanophycinase n=1 Tax=Singulisphaera sp. PoT TaxID=3411797 RepID=UPI003BF5B864
MRSTFTVLRRVAVLVVLSLATLPLRGRADDSPQAITDPTRMPIGPKAGSLLIVGGGQLLPQIAERFVSLASGTDAEVVLIPTAIEGEHLDLDALSRQMTEVFGFKHVTTLHTRDRAEADSESFVAPLKTAKAVWFGGGRHWRLVDSYLGTRTQREIERVLERGGVVGGSSAGATIIGSFLVRGAREGNHIMVARDYQRGFGYLRDSAIDQHLLPRARAEDLVPVIADRPELLGLGIDEATAIAVHGDAFEVIGRGVVGIYDGKDHDGKPYYFIAPGEHFDLRARRRASLKKSAPPAHIAPFPRPSMP